MDPALGLWGASRNSQILVVPPVTLANSGNYKKLMEFVEHGIEGCGAYIVRFISILGPQTRVAKPAQIWYSQREETDAFRITMEPVGLGIQRDAGPSRCDRYHLGEARARGHYLDIAHRGIGHTICTHPAWNTKNMALLSRLS